MSPVTARIVPITSSSVMNGATTRNVRVQEIVIAVAPEEVAPLDEAMDLKYKITCVARSGRPASVPRLPRAAGWRNRSRRTVSGPCRAGQGASGQTERGCPGQGFAAARTSRKPSAQRRAETPAKDRVAMDITPGLNPMADVRFMEVMIGTKRQFVLFNGPGTALSWQPQDDGSAKAGPAGGTGRAAEESEQ